MRTDTDVRAAIERKKALDQFPIDIREGLIVDGLMQAFEWFLEGEPDWAGLAEWNISGDDPED